MPIYSYKNPKTGKIVEVIQTMKEDHIYSENGVEFERVFSSPNASIDTKINPFSSKDFSAKLSNKKETIGSMWDRSRELSDKRTQKEGLDAVKEKYYENYSKKRRGKKHQDKINTTYTI